MFTNSGRVSVQLAPLWFCLTNPKVPGVVGISMASAMARSPLLHRRDSPVIPRPGIRGYILPPHSAAGAKTTAICAAASTRQVSGPRRLPRSFPCPPINGPEDRQ